MGTNKKGKQLSWGGRMVRSHGFRQFMSKTYGIGAAIVLVGAMFKINHFPGANIMLIAGLSVEAFIFLMSAFEPLHEEVDWSLVYPELGGEEGAGVARVAAPRSFSGEQQPLLTEKLDQMLHSANIDANLLSSLKDGLTKLNTTAQNLNASADIVGVNANYAGELDKLTESLGRLNNIYTQQIEASSRQMEVTMKAQQDMSRIAEALAGTLESSAKSVAEMNSLSEKVNSLNKVYGGMLSAFKSIGKDS